MPKSRTRRRHRDPPGATTPQRSPVAEVKHPDVLAVVVVITASGGNVRQYECMIITGGSILKLLSEGSLRRLDQPTEHLEDSVAALMITGERTPTRDVPHGVLGNHRFHARHVTLGKRLERPTNGLGIRVLRHQGLLSAALSLRSRHAGTRVNSPRQ